MSGTFVSLFAGIGGLTRTQALKALGNAVVPQQGAAAFGALLEFATIEGGNE